MRHNRSPQRCCLLILLIAVLASTAVSGAEKADRVVVEKSQHQLTLYHQDTVLARFDVVFGGNPQGHKQQEGDERTPEGHYTLDYKKADSAYFKAIHISYPNSADVADAARRGVSPGGAIMIHGQRNGFGWASGLMQHINWTNGCIALDNDDMQQVWDAVDAGTPIDIQP